MDATCLCAICVCRVCVPVLSSSSDSLTGYLIHTDVSLIGSIEFSDSLMNSIQSAVHWGQRCNILSLPTDCPQRDERKVHSARHTPTWPRASFPPPSL